MLWRGEMEISRNLSKQPFLAGSGRNTENLSERLFSFIKIPKF